MSISMQSQAQLQLIGALVVASTAQYYTDELTDEEMVKIDAFTDNPKLITLLNIPKKILPSADQYDFLNPARVEAVEVSVNGDLQQVYLFSENMIPIRDSRFSVLVQSLKFGKIRTMTEDMKLLLNVTEGPIRTTRSTTHRMGDVTIAMDTEGSDSEFKDREYEDGDPGPSAPAPQQSFAQDRDDANEDDDDDDNDDILLRYADVVCDDDSTKEIKSKDTRPQQQTATETTQAAAIPLKRVAAESSSEDNGNSVNLRSKLKTARKPKKRVKRVDQIIDPPPTASPATLSVVALTASPTGSSAASPAASPTSSSAAYTSFLIPRLSANTASDPTLAICTAADTTTTALSSDSTS
ncbi:unnamed protein product [Mucor circinelloides]